jgi:hypothetical protein
MTKKKEAMNTYLRLYEDGTVTLYKDDEPRFFKDPTGEYVTYIVDFDSGVITRKRNGWIHGETNDDRDTYYINDRKIGFIEPNKRSDKPGVDLYVQLTRKAGGDNVYFWTNNLSVPEAKLIIEGWGKE